MSSPAGFVLQLLTFCIVQMNAEILNRNGERQGPSHNDQYVDGPKLLEMLFPEECRPTLRWLHDQHMARRIPSIKIGRLVFYSPAQVRKALENKA